MTETILDESAVSEIEAEISLWRDFPKLQTKLSALCATVKHLRATEKLLQEQVSRLAELAETRSDLIAAKAAHVDQLQSQLEQLRAIAEGALRFRIEMNGACNHDEYMTKLCTQCEIREALEKP